MIITYFKIKKQYLWIPVLGLIISSCAQITSPTGGKKDTEPPVIIKSTPLNYSVNFHRKEIKIAFSEWIQPIQNPKNQIIISPPIEPFPKIEAARNELTIKLKDTLQSNTTYSIFFGDNIKDNNEGNAYPNYKYIFSTGNFIDSLRVRGVVKTMLDKIPDNTYLLLYKQKEDSAFTGKRPFYITKISSDGSFSLENVKEGDYRIYALSDKNGNYYYDLPTEEIGFTDSLYHINSDLDTLTFSLFLPEENKLRVFDFDRVINGGVLHLTLNRELSFTRDEISVSILEKKEIEPIAFPDEEPNNSGKAGRVTVYFPKMPADTGSFTILIKNKEQLIDSLAVRMESKSFKKPILFFNDTTAYKSLSVVETKSLKLVSSYYSLSTIDTARIIISDTSGRNIPFNVSRDENLRTYVFTADWKPGVNYKLQLSDSALSDLVGNYSRKQDFPLSVIPLKKTGNLLITYELPEKPGAVIVFLKDNSGKVLDKRILRDSQAVKINYGQMVPGTYNVEVINDANDNGIWNSGNFTTKILPERIYKEPKPIIVKENWEAEEKIKVDFNVIHKITTPNTGVSKKPADKSEKGKLLGE